MASIYPSIHLLINKYFLPSYCIPGTVLGARGIVMSKIEMGYQAWRLLKVRSAIVPSIVLPLKEKSGFPPPPNKTFSFFTKRTFSLRNFWNIGK